ncbi:MAG: TIM-barrel domain-containing protein [Myxococcota bacterium]
MKLRRKQTWLAVLASVWMVACPKAEHPSSVSHVVGAFRVDVDGTHVTVRSASDPGRVLLDSVNLEPGYAPVSVRSDEATFEMLYGSFLITDGIAPWTAPANATSSLENGVVRLAWTASDGNALGVTTLESPSEGALHVAFEASAPDVNRVAMAFACAESDRFLGFGAQADSVDHHGHTVAIWTSEPGIGKSDSDEPNEFWFLQGTRHASSMGLPTWLSNRGYLAVVDNDHRSIFEMCSTRADAWRAEVWDRRMDLWLYDGPEPMLALERATAGALGRPVRPPPLAFAPWHDAVYGSQSVRDMARLIREQHVPSSLIWSEDFRGGNDVEGQGYRLEEDWDLDRALYPDAETLAAELHANGFAWMAYYNTFIVQGADIYDEAIADGHVVKKTSGDPYLFDGVTFDPTALADLSRPETREWVKQHLRAAVDVGFDGWMADYGEWLPHDAVLSSGEDALAAHNRYPREWTSVCAEVLAERTDGRQRLFFARSGWLRSNTHVPVFWAGDQRTSFQRDDGLFTVIPIGINLGLAGVSTYGHDIAGYQSATNDPSTKELYFRWTTLGALSPVMRTHHGIDARANWWWGKDEETLAHFKRWASFHIRLFPYLDGGSKVAETRGIPLVRGLALEFPSDGVTWTVSDQFMLGPALLVSPVVDEGATSRTAHLPPGTWLPWDGGAPVTGPTDVTLALPVTEIGLHARAGSVIPLLDPTVETLLPADPPLVDLDDVAGRRVLRVFLGADGSFEEREGIRYVLSSPAGAVPGGFQQGGQALSSCAEPAAAPCLRSRDDDARLAVVLMNPAQPLEMTPGTLTVQGNLTHVEVEVRW